MAGNRTSATVNGVTTSQSYNAANQVSGWTYDAAGNLLSDGTTAYTYDALGRTLTQGSTSYAYNGDGVLVQAGTTHYTQDLASPLSQVLTDGSANYIYGLDRLASSAGTWYLGDALGSVRQTLAASGAVLTTASYDPWGTPQGSTIAPFGFTGELQDSAGQVYLRARWYNPGAGVFTRYRWETQETINTRPFSHHPYQYAYANPVNYLDPTGKCAPESDGPYACNPSLRSALKQYLRDSHPFDNRARGDQAFNGINVVFDSYPDTAYTYALLQDSELRAFITGQLPWLDADATIAQLNFNLRAWRMNYAQKNNLNTDVWGATAGVLGLGAVYGVECFFSPDRGGGGGGAGRLTPASIAGNSPIKPSDQGDVSKQIVLKYAEEMKNGTFDWNSMTKNGRPDPIVILRTADGQQFLAEGHHRFLASRLAGVDLPPPSPGVLEYRDVPFWSVGTEWTNIRWRW